MKTIGYKTAVYLLFKERVDNIRLDVSFKNIVTENIYIYIERERWVLYSIVKFVYVFVVIGLYIYIYIYIYISIS